MKLTSLRATGPILLATFSLWAEPPSLRAGETRPVEVVEPTPLSKWWDGKYATADWFGGRDTLEDYGISLTGMWRGFFYGTVGGGLERHGAFDEEIRFLAKVDFDRLLNNPDLAGLTANAKVRWRDGRNPNTYVGAYGAFGPSDVQSGQQWRFDYAYLSYVTPELFGIKGFLTVSGGWQNPYDFFLDTPLENLFVNNTFSGTRGLANIPWSSSYGAWGGYFKIKPASWWYLMNGLYLGVPNATSVSNHGLYFQGYAPNPNSNGLFYIGEAGLTPKWGASKLPGKYAFGGYYFGVDKASFAGDSPAGQFGLYWQVDQMLWREPSAAAESAFSGDDKAAKTPGTAAPSEQGLSFFGMLSYAPAFNNPLPFYLTSGLVYKGLIPTRDADQAMFACAYGQYSIDEIDALQTDGIGSQPRYTTLIEGDYRIQVNQWSYVQPFCQYIIKPDGTNDVANAAVLGVAVGIAF